jgi:hypothetical protein
MLNTYLISYDLIGNKSIADYERLHNMIKSASTWAKPLESVWIIKTPLNASQVRDHLMNAISTSDKLLVIGITKEWAAYNLSKEVADWIKVNI